MKLEPKVKQLNEQMKSIHIEMILYYHSQLLVIQIQIETKNSSCLPMEIIMEKTLLKF